MLLSAVLAGLGWSVEAAAAADVSPTPWALESGGAGCYDPMSWVWAAPRAERVAISWAEPVACEIGTPDCDRQPESLPAAPVWLGDAVAVCAFKEAQHDSGLGDEPFDTKSCLRAEGVALEALESPDVPLPDPGESLTCSRQDPECQPMPPAPQRPPTGTLAPPALPGPWLARAEAAVDRSALPDYGDAARSGFLRRLERPPSARA